MAYVCIIFKYFIIINTYLVIICFLYKIVSTIKKINFILDYKNIFGMDLNMVWNDEKNYNVCKKNFRKVF